MCGKPWSLVQVLKDILYGNIKMGRKALPVLERTTIKHSKENCDAFSKHPYRLALLRGEVPHTDDPELLRKRAEWAQRKAAWLEKEAARKAQEASTRFLVDSDSEDNSKMASKFI